MDRPLVRRFADRLQPLDDGIRSILLRRFGVFQRLDLVFDLVHARTDVGNDVRRKSGRGEIPDQVVVFRPLLIDLLLDRRCKRFTAFLLVILVGTQNPL